MAFLNNSVGLDLIKIGKLIKFNFGSLATLAGASMHNRHLSQE
jgi:hypothetical protein